MEDLEGLKRDLNPHADLNNPPNGLVNDQQSTIPIPRQPVSN